MALSIRRIFLLDEEQKANLQDKKGQKNISECVNEE